MIHGEVVQISILRGVWKKLILALTVLYGVKPINGEINCRCGRTSKKNESEYVSEL